MCQNHKADEPTEETLTVKSYARKKKKTIDEMAKGLPVKQILLELPEDTRIYGKCGGNFKLIGKQLVRQELQIIPRQCQIVEYYSCSYACDRCEKDAGFAHIVATQAPPALMKHSRHSITNGRVHYGPGRKCLSRCVVIIRLQKWACCKMICSTPKQIQSSRRGTTTAANAEISHSRRLYFTWRKPYFTRRQAYFIEPVAKYELCSRPIFYVNISY